MMGWCPYDNKECRHDGYCEDCEHNKCRDCNEFSCDWCVYSNIRAVLRAVKAAKEEES